MVSGNSSGDIIGLWCASHAVYAFRPRALAGFADAHGLR